MYKFYFDEYNSVTAKGYEGPAFFMDGEQETAVVFFNDLCKLPFDIKLRNRYKVRIGEKEYSITYRFITHTEKFDKEHAYDGKLGTVYNREYTEFYLWSPTAYSVTVQLQNGRKIPMEYTEKGVYFVRAEGDFEGVGYSYIVEHEKKVEALDPNAISSTVNSKYNYVIDPKKIEKSKAGVGIADRRNAIVYETNVRDFTSDRNIAFEYHGKYKGMTERGIKDNYGNKVGFDYVLDLGVTHIQLMPVYDYGSIDERDCSVGYNWGYDPVQFNVPEGKYSCNPCDPYERLNELVALVNEYHKEGIGVIMDVVYNHVYDHKTFSFGKIVPYYFFRYQGGKVSDASYCGNETASERYMVRRFIADSIEYLTKTFGFDGYRFDLMGIVDCETMNLVQEKASSINPNIYIFGEGWTMPTAIPTEMCATQTNYEKLPNIGFFNDDFRNTCKQVMIGHINSHKGDTVKRLLQGLDYENPINSLQYISCHDDYTIFDQLYYGFEQVNVFEQIKLGYAFVFLGQGNSFLHAGCEAGRTKQGLKNSFKESEVINRLDWDLIQSNQSLVSYVKELIRVRRLPEFYLCESRDEVQTKTSVSENDGCVSYYINDWVIYINLKGEPITISINGTLISQDGQQKDSNEETEITIEYYGVVKTK